MHLPSAPVGMGMGPSHRARPCSLPGIQACIWPELDQMLTQQFGFGVRNGAPGAEGCRGVRKWGIFNGPGRRPLRQVLPFLSLGC